MSERYRPYDQPVKLGPPPWDPLAEDVASWERAHGHDVRLDCDDTDCLLTDDETFREGYESGWNDAIAYAVQHGVGEPAMYLVRQDPEQDTGT